MFKIGDRVRLDSGQYRGELEFTIRHKGEVDDIVAGKMGNVIHVKEMAMAKHLGPENCVCGEQFQFGPAAWPAIDDIAEDDRLELMRDVYAFLRAHPDVALATISICKNGHVFYPRAMPLEGESPW